MSCLVGEPLALRALHRASSAFGVIDAQADAVRVAVIELRQIAMQMFFGAMLIGAAHTALED